jgi:primosomal protein N' (replication factor Y)
VILQTYNPHHFSIEAACSQDYDAFYRQEIEFRKALGYPPFTRMIQVRIQGRDLEKTREYVHRLAGGCRRLRRNGGSHAEVDVLGPIEAPLARIADRFRWQLLLKSPSAGAARGFVRELVFGSHAPRRTRHIEVGIDVDPHFLM